MSNELPELPVAHLHDLRPLFLRAQRDERVGGLEEFALEGGAGHDGAVGQPRRRRQVHIVVVAVFRFMAIVWEGIIWNLGIIFKFKMQ